MRRRRAREYALQILFSLEMQESDSFSSNEIDSEIHTFIENFAPPTFEASVDKDYLMRLLKGICSNLPELDEQIEKCSEHWKLYRMTKIDRNILRVGAQELKSFTDVPSRVTIDECVELAKKFGTEESSAFVNGILDKICTLLGRAKE